jgi:hypothetical protein
VARSRLGLRHHRFRIGHVGDWRYPRHALVRAQYVETKQFHEITRNLLTIP